MRWKAPTAVLSFVAAIQLGPAAALEIPQPAPLKVSAHGLTATATGGTYCGEFTEPPEEGSDGAPVDFCADAGYPLRTRGRLPVRGRTRVTINTGEPARSVSVHLKRVRGNDVRAVSKVVDARRVRAGNRRWALRLPHDLREANVLDITVIYPTANGNFWAGLRSDCGRGG